MRTKLSSESLKLLCQASFSCREEMQHLSDVNMNLRNQCVEFSADLQKYKMSMAAGPNEDKFYSYQFPYHDEPTLMSSDVFYSMMNEKRMALVTTRLEIEDNQRKINELDRLMEVYDEDAIAFGSEELLEQETPDETPEPAIWVRDVMMNRMDVFSVVQSVLSDILIMSEENITEDSFLRQDLGLFDEFRLELALTLAEKLDWKPMAHKVRRWLQVGAIVDDIMQTAKGVHQ